MLVLEVALEWAITSKKAKMDKEVADKALRIEEIQVHNTKSMEVHQDNSSNQAVILGDKEALNHSKVKESL